MAFVNKNRKDEQNEALPGGLHLDLDRRLCPACRRETAPWEDRCPDCGEATVPPEQVPATEFPLPPGLRDLAEEGLADAGLEDDPGTDRD